MTARADYYACREQESEASHDGGGRKGRLRCNRPQGHEGPHRHYTKAAEVVVEWARA